MHIDLFFKSPKGSLALSLYEGGTPFAGIDAVASGGPPAARNMKKAEEAGTHACMYTHTQTIAPISHKWLLY